jgi:hypothetical protein
MKKMVRNEKKEAKKQIKKSLHQGEWTPVPSIEKEKPIPKIERFNWADEV